MQELAEKVTLIKIKNPFNRNDRDIEMMPFRYGMTLLDLYKENFPENVDVVVSLNGEIVKNEDLAKVIIKPNDYILFIPDIRGGGGGGGKNILRVVLMIAVVALSYWLAPGIATALGIAGSFGTPFVAGMLTFVGGMLINAFLPMPKPKLASLPDSESSVSYSWSPATTQQQGIVVPRIYGRMKTYGNIISGHIRTIENPQAEQYLYLLIGLCEGPIEAIEEIKLNDQPIASYDNCEYHIRYGDLNQSYVPNFGEDNVTYNYSLHGVRTKATYARWSKGFIIGGPNLWVEVKADSTDPSKYTEGASAGDGDVWHWLSVGEDYANCVEIETVANDFQGLDIEISYPKGLYYVDNEMRPYDVHYQIRYKHEKWNGWRIATLMSVRAQPAPRRWSYGVYLRDWRGISPYYSRVWYEVKAGSDNPSEHTEGKKDTSIDTQLGCYWHWLTETDYISTTTHLYVLDYQLWRNPGKRTFYLRDLKEGKYKIRFIRLNANQFSSRYADETWLTAVKLVYNRASTYPRTALVGLKIKATDQLSGSVRFSCIVKGQKVRVYNKTNNTWEVKWTDNPAWICWDILTQPVFNNNLQVIRYDGIHPSKLDLQKFIEWADFCDELVPDGKGGKEKRITFNGTFDTQTNVWEAALQVCAVGRAMLVMNGSKLSVAVDKESQAVQMFSVGNIIQDSFKETYLSLDDRANELEIDFINAENDYERDKVVFADHNQTVKVRSNFTLIGLTKPSEVLRFARYQLAKNKYITKAIEFMADIDAIACTVGDVIYVQHDIPQWQYGGRIVSATSTTVTLDKPIYVYKNKSYSILIRTSSDVIISRAIAQVNQDGEYDTFTVTTPFDTLPQQYDVFIFGETARVAKPFRITSIGTDKEQKATITAIEYNPEIYATDYTSNIKQPKQYSVINRFPSVTDLKLDELLIKNSDGTLMDTINVFFNPPQDEFYLYAEIWCRIRDKDKNVITDWSLLGRCYSSKYTINNVRVNYYYDVKVVTVNIAKEKQPLGSAPTKTIFTLGKLDPPSDVTEFKATYKLVKYIGYINLNWKHIPDADLSHYEIRCGQKWATAQIIASKVVNNKFQIVATKNGTYTYLIKAVDTSGKYSVNASSATVTVYGLTTKSLISGTIWKEVSGAWNNLVYIDGVGFKQPHGLFDTDIPTWTDMTEAITNYKGDINFISYYESKTKNLGEVYDKAIILSYDIDADELFTTDLTYPDRTNLTYPADTDLNITPEATVTIFYALDNNEYTEYFTEVYAKFRYIKVKILIEVKSNTAIVVLKDFSWFINLIQKDFILLNEQISSSGNTYYFADYELQFREPPQVTVTPTDDALIPEVVVTRDYCIVKLKDLSNNYASGNASILIGGV